MTFISNLLDHDVPAHYVWRLRERYRQNQAAVVAKLNASFVSDALEQKQVVPVTKQFEFAVFLSVEKMCFVLELSPGIPSGFQFTANI